MADKKLFCVGACGTSVAAICCFTPLLVVAFGALGVSAWLGWADYVLFPMLGLFIAITVYALVRRPRKPVPQADPAESR